MASSSPPSPNPSPSPGLSSSTASFVKSSNGIEFIDRSVNTQAKIRNFHLGAFGTQVDGAYRKALTGKDLIRFHEQATSALPNNKFSLTLMSIDVDKDEDCIRNNNIIITLKQDLDRRLRSHYMESVFSLVPFDDFGNIVTSAHQVDLIQDVFKVTEHQVRYSNELYAVAATDDLHGQNLLWSQELLLASCDTPLQIDLANKLISIPEAQQGGPLIYYLIMRQLVSVTYDASRSIIHRLTKLSVTDFPGENIAAYCATFTNIIIRLQISNSVPHDLPSIFLHGLKTCTVEDFVFCLKTMQVLNDACLSNFGLLKAKALEWFESLTLDKKWLVTTSTTGAHFNASIKETKKVGDQDSFNKRAPFKIDTTPPKEGEPDSRPHPTNPNWKTYWCAECPNGNPNGKGRWGNHSTSRHDPNRVGRRRKKNTGSDPSTVSPSTPPNDTGTNNAVNATTSPTLPSSLSSSSNSLGMNHVSIMNSRDFS
jgi:hypothetical protein